MVKVKVAKRPATKAERKQVDFSALVRLITDTSFNFDPYNGADYEDVYNGVSEMLQTLEGCYSIIRDTCEMLNEALE